MKILKQINNSREGNDCWIDETYTMCEWNGIYYIIRHWKASGWSDQEKVYIINEPTCDKEAINKLWKNLVEE